MNDLPQQQQMQSNSIMMEEFPSHRHTIIDLPQELFYSILSFLAPKVLQYGLVHSLFYRPYTRASFWYDAISHKYSWVFHTPHLIQSYVTMLEWQQQKLVQKTAATITLQSMLDRLQHEEASGTVNHDHLWFAQKSDRSDDVGQARIIAPNTKSHLLSMFISHNRGQQQESHTVSDDVVSSKNDNDDDDKKMTLHKKEQELVRYLQQIYESLRYHPIRFHVMLDDENERMGDTGVFDSSDEDLMTSSDSDGANAHPMEGESSDLEMIGIDDGDDESEMSDSEEETREDNGDNDDNGEDYDDEYLTALRYSIGRGRSTVPNTDDFDARFNIVFTDSDGENGDDEAERVIAQGIEEMSDSLSSSSSEVEADAEARHDIYFDSRGFDNMDFYDRFLTFNPQRDEHKSLLSDICRDLDVRDMYLFPQKDMRCEDVSLCNTCITQTIEYRNSSEQKNEEVNSRQNRSREVDRLLVAYCNNYHYSSDECIRTNYPIPDQEASYSLPVWYVEFTILSADVGADSNCSIGLGPRCYKKTRQPGWNRVSAAYHGDDGGKFLGDGAHSSVFHPYGLNDTVGLGIYFATNEIFITKNGKLDVLCSLDDLRRYKYADQLEEHKLYLLMGFWDTLQCEVNFGNKPFVFQIEHLCDLLDMRSE